MQKEKFASQADPEVLAALRAIAEKEGRQFQALIDEAFQDLLEKKRTDKPRRHVMAAFEESLKELTPATGNSPSNLMTDYLTLADVLAQHHVLIEEHGGAHGIRDMGALEAAIFRPQTGYYDDVIAEAAALMESIAINHPFIDGNKRVALAVTDTFLRINGYRLKQPSDGPARQMIDWFEGRKFEFKYIETWLRKHVKRHS